MNVCDTFPSKSNLKQKEVFVRKIIFHYPVKTIDMKQLLLNSSVEDFSGLNQMTERDIEKTEGLTKDCK